MSSSSQLFFHPGHQDIRAAAHSLSSALDGRVLADNTDVDVIAIVKTSTGDLRVVGSVEDNEPLGPPGSDNPSDREIFDAYPMMWTMRVNPKSEDDVLRRAAREVFDRLVASGLGWPIVLSFEFALLEATYDQERGVRTFPPGTATDGTDEHLWR